MRQGKGTDVLGANDPRSDTIGVIYVSPNDDRKSVLAAILTQEKLGRQQVAVVLPSDQNKAFQHPGDFDELKTWRRKLQAQVVFIAPSGPGPAEFARQRRFHVYSSLENYANALRDEVQVESASKKGWLFGSPHTKAEGVPSVTNSHRGGTRMPTEPLDPATQELDMPANGHAPLYENDEDDEQRSPLPFMAGAAIGGGAAIAADSALNAQGRNSAAMANPRNFEDDADDLGPLPATPARQPASENLYGPTQTIPPAQAEDAAVDNGSIIELRPRRSSKATLPLTPRGPAPVPATPIVAQEPEPTTRIPRPRRSSGKIAAAAGVGAVAGVAAADEIAATPARPAATPSRASSVAGPGTFLSRPGGPGGIPPRGTPPGGGGGRNNRRGPNSPLGWLIFGAVVLLMSLLVCGGVMAYAQPNSLPGHVARGLFSQQQSPATITITPSSQTVQDTYTLVGANTTNATSRQVAVRTITGAAQSPSTSVRASGRAQHNATAATGTLTFFNNASAAQQVNAGTSFNVGGGVMLVSDAAAYIPAGNGFNNGHLAVSAHATPVGRAGNVGADVLNVTPCCAGGISVSNSAFTGGQDAVNYAFLQQSDVSNAISQTTMDSTKLNALSDIDRQLHTGEQFIGGTRCKTTLHVDEPLGDQGSNVNSANVGYGMQCTATAYDNQGAQNTVKGLVTQKATSTLSSGYTLINNIQTSLTGHTVANNTLSLFFNGKGVWAYQFSDAQKLQLAKSIAGKTVTQAQNILKNTPGIGSATINVNGGSTLPTDYNQISMVIQPIAGLGNVNTTPPAIASPTITGPTIQSGTPGNNGKGGSAPPTGGGS